MVLTEITTLSRARMGSHNNLEIKDLLTTFSNPERGLRAYALKKDDPYLTWHGIAINPQDEAQGEPLSKLVVKVAEDFLTGSDADPIEFSMDIEAFEIDGQEFDDVEPYDFQAKIREVTPEGLFYNPDTDCMYVGFDVWIDEELFNDGWDEFFRAQTGLVFDHDDEEHAKAFELAWQNYLKLPFLGALVRVSHKDGELRANEEYMISGGFHKAIYPSVRRGRYVEVNF